MPKCLYRVSTDTSCLPLQLELTQLVHVYMLVWTRWGSWCGGVYPCVSVEQTTPAGHQTSLTDDACFSSDRAILISDHFHSSVSLCVQMSHTRAYMCPHAHTHTHYTNMHARKHTHFSIHTKQFETNDETKTLYAWPVTVSIVLVSCQCTDTITVSVIAFQIWYDQYYNMHAQSGTHTKKGW